MWSEALMSSGEEEHSFVRAEVHPAGGRWRAAEAVSTEGSNPHVAVDGRGEAIAVWETDGGSEVSVRPSGGGWLAPQTLFRPGADEPEVATDAMGDAVVISWSEEPGYTGLHAVARPAGGSLSSEYTITRGYIGADPGIVMNARGDTFVAWTSDDAGKCFLRGAYRGADGNWSAPHAVVAHTFSPAPCPRSEQIAIDARGDAIVVWEVARGGKTFIEAAERGATGRWTSRGIISRVPGGLEGVARVGMDAQGGVIVVWGQAARSGGRRTMWYRLGQSGQGWQPARRIAGVEGWAPSLAVDARGDALLAWQDESGVTAVVRPAGGGWGKPVIVARHPPSELGVSRGVVAALDARGGGLLTWSTDQNLKTSWDSALFAPSK